mmetsp:Transcript_9779/g.27286  ORF Transcript_9779/g.27286 Transcript_9779/m.27286 type:complete len:114 (-) Transcript_9779:130-471(-)
MQLLAGVVDRVLNARWRLSSRRSSMVDMHKGLLTGMHCRPRGLQIEPRLPPSPQDHPNLERLSLRPRGSDSAFDVSKWSSCNVIDAVRGALLQNRGTHTHLRAQVAGVRRYSC